MTRVTDACTKCGEIFWRGSPHTCTPRGGVATMAPRKDFAPGRCVTTWPGAVGRPPAKGTRPVPIMPRLAAWYRHSVLYRCTHLLAKVAEIEEAAAMASLAAVSAGTRADAVFRLIDERTSPAGALPPAHPVDTAEPLNAAEQAVFAEYQREFSEGATS